jgi:pyruvate,water dikinase
MTRYWAEVHPASFRRGFSELTAYYGMLIDSLDYRYVNGLGYKTVVPVPDSEVPARFQRADEAIQGKLWREQLREWDETFKPTSIAAHRELQSVDPDALSDEELAAYLTRCRDPTRDDLPAHALHRRRGAADRRLPGHVIGWTGLSPAELLGLMRGASPVSSGASDELERLIEALASDPSARAILDSDGDPSDVLERLRSQDGEVGAAASAYLDLVGYRLLDGFDISGRYALELPDALVQAIRLAADTSAPGESDVAAHIAEVRDRVPEEHQAEFDELLEEARLTYRLRDERGVFSDIWASGIMRR